MRLRQILLLLAGALIASGPGAWAAGSGKLSRLFKYEMLNAQVAYLETITGPAMHIDAIGTAGQSRDYRIDGCLVTATVSDNVVTGFWLTLSPKCNVDFSGLLGPGYVMSTNALTLAKFVRGPFDATVRAQSSCISFCGNAADPTIDFTWEGPHAANFLTVVLEVTLDGQPALDAVGHWDSVMEAKEGHDYVIDTKFNCDQKYDGVAVKDFGNVKVTRVYIGSDPQQASFKNGCGQ